MKNTTKGKAGIILAMMIFGSIGLLVRSIDATSSQIALSRAVIGSVFLFALIIIRRRSSKKSTNKINILSYGKTKIIILIISGAAIGFNWIFLFQAYRYTSIAVATVSYYFAPIFVILLSPLVLAEKLDAHRIMAVSIAFVGLIMTIVGELTNNSVIPDHINSRNGLIGIGYGIAAALLYASVILLTKRAGNFPGLEMTQIQLFSGMIVLFPYVALTAGFEKFSMLDANSILFLIILGIVHTGLAYFLYFSSARWVKAQSIAVLSYIDPLFAITFAAVFLLEIPGPLQIIGGLLILGATYFSETLSEKIKQRKSSETAKTD